MTKSGFAILGLDHWYAAFDIARQIAKSDQAQLVSVSHSDAARAEQFAAEFGADVHSTNDRAALDVAGIDVVVTLHSVDRNAELCRTAAASGKHIISVKPMAMSVPDAHSVAQAVKDANVHFFSLDALYRLSPERTRLKHWLKEGRIGQPVRFAQILHAPLPMDWPGGAHNGGWWVDAARAPGGGWIDHAIYAIDNARWLFESEPVRVSGHAANVRHAELALEDYGIATFEFANGAVAVIEDTWTAEPGSGLHRNEWVGSAGAVLEDGGAVSGRLAVRGNFGYDGWTVIEPLRQSGKSTVDYMIACARGEMAPVATVDDAVANLSYCLSFYQAARAGRTVNLSKV